jgi:hypothetical protein
MKKNKKIYDNLIDKYYNDVPEKNISFKNDHFEEKLKLSLDKMSILNTDSEDFPIDIMEIIERGELIKEKKKTFLEFSVFISTAVFIISLLVFITLFINQDFFMYCQLLAFIFMPLLIIPLAKSSLNGGNHNASN